MIAAAIILVVEAVVFAFVLAKQQGASRPPSQTQIAAQQSLQEITQEPQPEADSDPSPVTTACLSCGTQLKLGTPVCPLCQWDQSIDPSTLPTTAPCVKCGEEIDLDLTICPYCEWDQTRDPNAKEYFTITMVGDCTLASDKSNYGSPHTLVGTVGDDYDYPFANVRDLFESDEFTIVNLECNLTDSSSYSDMLFAFRGPSAYTNIMTGSSVEMASFANNHIIDYGQTGYNDTITAMQEAGLAYVERDCSTIYTTENGLTIGVYAAMFWGFDETDMVNELAALRDTVDVVIASLHWGDEGRYRPTSEQERLARLAIDSGADIVYGHHPHVLQKVETYEDGIIFYSLGNFCFGGNTNPRDKDTAIARQTVVRDAEGNISLGETELLPCCVSSRSDYNTYQPTLYEPGTEEYDRVMSKLDGTFTGADLVVNYDNITQ